MKVVITGGSGFLGRAVTSALLSEGHHVTWLTRASRGPVPGVETREWTPDGTAGGWAHALDGSDALLNLAGESIGEGRWNEARRALIRDSRLLATRSVVQAIRTVSRPPRVLLSGSGQGYYGDRGDEERTEESPPGDDFLARVCVDWEAEAQRAEQSCRVVLLRTSLALDGKAGALPRMLQPYKFFAGGPIGSGRQFMSWIHRDDWVSLARLALEDERFVGPVNVCSPQPVRNSGFAAALGLALGKPAGLKTPAFVLRAALGEMAQGLLLSSQRLKPARALQLGFGFRFPDLSTALRDLLAR